MMHNKADAVAHTPPSMPYSAGGSSNSNGTMIGAYLGLRLGLLAANDWSSWEAVTRLRGQERGA